jgi:hypothetical protein
VDDFGATAWLDGLEVLVDSATTEAGLNEFGWSILQSWVHERLVNRLRVVDWVRSHPGVREQQIVRPFVVVGMLRTGTTILSELLAADPANRPLMKWEGLDSIPPPRAETFTTDPRIAAMVAQVEATYSMVPKLKAVHIEPGDGPTECVALLSQSFRSQDWLGLFHVPAYVTWYHGCDMRPAYDYHRLSLRVLQSGAPGRWSLKAPGHLLALDALTAVYPDACIVVTHRDPAKTVPSSISLSTTSRPDSLTSVDLEGYFPRLWFDALGLMTDRLVEYRDREGDERFYDLQFRDLVADPVAEVARVYEHFGDRLSAEAERAMRTHLAANPQGRHGSHQYFLEQFGLRAEQVRERFGAYCERFDIEPEEV